MTRILLTSCVALAASAWLTAEQSARSQTSPGLRVIVIAGDDAVNIIQQKTAVTPIVEVRDRNDVPVVGATVTFAIQGGKAAAFGSASTLTVATNAAGQAVATGFSPLAAGAVQINVQAAFQGQIAVATLTQTNVMTAAQAAAVTASGASGSTTGASGAATGAGGSGGTGASAGAGAAAGGGGGLSATTIGIIGAAAAGGAVVATKVTGGSAPQRYSGPFAFDWVVGCLVERITGTLTVEFDTSSDAPDAALSNGTFRVRNGSAQDGSRPPTCAVRGQGNWGMNAAPLTGALSSFDAHGQDSVPSQAGGGTIDRSYDFHGALGNGVITGTFGMTWRSSTPPVIQSSGSSAVTLSRSQ